MKQPKSFDEEMKDLKEAWKDLFYLVGKDLGLIWLAKWLIKKGIFFSELKDWVKERENARD